MTNHYELLYLISGTYSENELTPIKEKIKKIIESNEGKVTLEDSLGKKKLAYPIKNMRQGYYLLYELDLPAEKLTKPNRDLKLTTEVLRHQIVSRKPQTRSFLEITKEKIKREREEKPKEKKVDTKGKIKLEDLDQKLDEILEGDIMWKR